VDERGNATIEMALLLPLFLLMLLLVVEVASVGKMQMEVIHAARQGARQAAADPEVALAAKAARAALPGYGDVQVQVRRDHKVGGEANVVVSVKHRVELGFLRGPTITIRAKSAMRVEQ
jgi:Flp pilus assembly protein TadG